MDGEPRVWVEYQREALCGGFRTKMRWRSFCATRSVGGMVIFRGSIVVKLAALLLVTLGLTGAGTGRSAAVAQTQSTNDNAHAARLAEEWVKNNPPGRTKAEALPVVKDNRYPQVSPEEREAIGLPAPTWVATYGKVQPAVRAALDHQKKLIEGGDPMVEFQGDRHVGFQGTAYVDVYLRHGPKGKPTSTENQAAVREAQAMILRKLTAAEFALIFAFKSAAGLTGYVDEAGLAKLVDDPDVVAIGLDDQARPKDPPAAMKEPPAPGTVQRRSERRGKVDVSVYDALEKSTDGYVFVDVGVTQIPLEKGAFWQQYEAKEAAARRVAGRVLSTLTAEEFRCRSRSGSSFAGFVNAAGLAKLAAHPDVRGAELLTPAVFHGDVKENAK